MHEFRDGGFRAKWRRYKIAPSRLNMQRHSRPFILDSMNQHEKAAKERIGVLANKAKFASYVHHSQIQ